MTFREFLVAFGKVNQKGPGIRFAQTVLLEATGFDPNFESILTNTPKDIISSYFRSDRNIASPFAEEVLSYFSQKRNRNQFREYIKDQCQTEEQLQSLCKAFKPYCPQITKETAINIVIAQFELMLEFAKSGETSEPMHVITETDKKEIMKLVGKLRSLTVELLQSVNELDLAEMISLMQPSNREWIMQLRNKLETNRKDFLEQNHILYNYIELYPDLSILKDVYGLSIELSTRCYDHDAERFMEYKNQYESGIKELLRTLRKL